jgi:cytoskeletal protein CcmA (bactofilin family)
LFFRRVLTIRINEAAAIGTSRAPLTEKRTGDQKMKTRTAASIPSGFLGEGTAVAGALQFSGVIRIDGNFQGSISTNDRLVVGEEAVVQGDITVGEIEIAGQVIGNIQASRRVELLATGHVQGDVHTSELVVAAGAKLDGKMFMAGNEANTTALVVMQSSEQGSNHPPS